MTWRVYPARGTLPPGDPLLSSERQDGEEETDADQYQDKPNDGCGARSIFAEQSSQTEDRAEESQKSA